MPAMSILVIVVVALLCLLVIATSWGRLRRGHGPRALLRGMGLVAALVGLYLSGLAALAGNGIRSIADWARRTPMDQTMQIGFIVLVAGLVLALVGTLIRPRTREQRAAVRDRRRGGPAPVQGATTPAAGAPRGSIAGSNTSEDDEVEAILRSRGIN